MPKRSHLVALSLACSLVACASSPQESPRKRNPQIDPLAVAQEHVEMLVAGKLDAAARLVHPDHRKAFLAIAGTGRFSGIPKRFELLLRSIGEKQAIVEVVGTRYEFDLRKIDGKWWMPK